MSRDPPVKAAGETAAQALERARVHARCAVAEALATVRALLDAASIGWSGRPSEAHAALRGIAELLDEQAARIQQGQAGVPAPLMNAVLEALDHEIERWEKQATSDPEARAVLRTFLGLREILWEFGLRRDESPRPQRAPSAGKAASAGTASRAGKARTRGRKAPGKDARAPSPAGRHISRVQRVDVQGD